jgi:diketogulonate reductase-like aldo/keto reductase
MSSIVTGRGQAVAQVVLRRLVQRGVAVIPKSGALSAWPE